MKCLQRIKGVWRRCGSALLATALASVCTSSLAQSPVNYPERTVRMVVPYAPGGAVDINARALALELGKLWGQAVVVDNKPGGAGVLGADLVAKAIPDGYTLLLSDNGILASMPLLQEKMPYDTPTDLVPVGVVGMFANMFAASTSLKVKSLQELVAAAQNKPGGINYATNGIGGTQHLAWERFQRTAAIRLNHIPYKSAPPALQDVLAGHVPVMMVAVATVFPFINDGRLVLLAVGSLERSTLMPNVPTVAESGFPGFEAISWTGVLAPKGTPSALVEKISADLKKVTQSKAYRDALVQRGTEPRTSSPKEMADRIAAETESNRKLIKVLAIKL